MDQMDPRRLLVNVAKVLNQLNIPYIVSGGVAILIWGRPRFTADIDIVMELKDSDVDKLERGLLKKSKGSYIDVNSIRQALADKSEFNFIDNETGMKVDFWVLKENDPFDISRMNRKVAKKIFGEKIYFSSAEDLILSKLIWYKISPSERQMDDVKSIFKISGTKLNKKYLNKWAEKLALSQLLNKLLEKIKSEKK